jgi:hypothetical protein
MFDKATRSKLRFESVQGLLTVEDLWDLPLQTGRANRASLDQIAIALNQQIKDTSSVSFVEDTPRTSEDLQLRFDIVKHIIDVKKAENAAAAAKREREATKARIVEIIARKQDQKLEETPLEELQEQLKSL